MARGAARNAGYTPPHPPLRGSEWRERGRPCPREGRDRALPAQSRRAVRPSLKPRLVGAVEQSRHARGSRGGGGQESFQQVLEGSAGSRASARAASRSFQRSGPGRRRVAAAAAFPSAEGAGLVSGRDNPAAGWAAQRPPPLRGSAVSHASRRCLCPNQ